MTRTTDSLRTRMDMATERLEAERASLYRPDGSKVYGEQEHRERMAAIRAEDAYAVTDFLSPPKNAARTEMPSAYGGRISVHLA